MVSMLNGLIGEERINKLGLSCAKLMLSLAKKLGITGLK